MRKYAYLAKLEELLAALPAQERQDALNFYEEYFDAAGSENEEKTAEELGDPAEVARKVLEGEGIAAPEEDSTQPDRDIDPPPAPTIDAAAEQPLPEDLPFAVSQNPVPETPVSPVQTPVRRSFSQVWLVVGVLIALALVIQLAVLASTLGGSDGEKTAASMIDSIESESTEAETLSPAPVDHGFSGSGLVTYTADIRTNGRGTLNIVINSGNVAFQTGKAGKIEVSNVDVSQAVTLSETDGEDSFTCESNDPATHVTVTLPADAYQAVNVMILNSGAIELGNLQAEEITAITAEGLIQSEQVCAGSLALQTNKGSIWLEKAANGTKYQLERVTLSAPQGYVSARLDAPEASWETKITNGEGYSRTTMADENTETVRYLDVQAGGKIDLQYTK